MGGQSIRTSCLTPSSPTLAQLLAPDRTDHNLVSARFCMDMQCLVRSGLIRPAIHRAMPAVDGSLVFHMVNDELVADLGKASDAVGIRVKSLPISTLPSAVATRSLTTSRLATLMFLSDAGLCER